MKKASGAKNRTSQALEAKAAALDQQMDRLEAMMLALKAERGRALQDVSRTEVCRSFSYKLNMARIDARLQYESRDFFCSQKAECTWEDAPQVSQAIYNFCREQVMQDVKEFVRQLRAYARTPAQSTDTDPDMKTTGNGTEKGLVKANA